MAIAVPSKTTQAYGSSAASIVFTKPTGLAEDDLMVAVVHTNDSPITPPAGWTLELSNSPVGNFVTHVYYKVASSADAAASNFTFGLDGSTIYRAGVLYRVTGYAPVILFEDSDKEVGGADNTAVIDIDGVSATDYLVIAFASNNDATPATIGSFTTNGTNPTWTYDLQTVEAGGAQPTAFTCASAIQAGPIDYTSLSYTATPDNPGARIIGMAVIPSQQDATAVLPLLSKTATIHAPTGIGGTLGTHTHLTKTPTLNAPTATARNIAQWTNENRPTTDWTNKAI